MISSVEDIAEIVRIPSPAPAPQALACDGASLWVGSWETQRVYGIDPHQGRVFEETTAPGKPVGATAAGDELFFVVSEANDSRFIRRFVPGHGFKLKNGHQCPDDTGSFLAYDGTNLWLSQRHNKRLLQLDAEYKAVRTIEAGDEVTGIAWVGERIYLALWLGRETGARIACVDPSHATPEVRHVARSPFPAISLARDGNKLWTNDFKNNEIVAFAIPE